MEQLFDIETGIEKEFSYANGKRKAKKVKRKAKREKKDADIVSGKQKKTKLRKAFQVFKKVNPMFATMRGSALSLININLWGMATRMAKLRDLSSANEQAKKAWIKILAHWIKFGGDKDKLINTIDKGKGKKQRLTRKSKKVKNTYASPKKKHRFDGEEGEFFDNAFQQEFSNVAGADDAVVATWITTASTVLATIIGVLRQNKNLVGEMPLTDSDKATLDENATASDLTTEDIAKGAEAAGQAEGNSEKIFGLPSNVVYLAGSLFIIVAIILVTRKKIKQ